MEKIDRLILEEIQREIPLSKEPFKVIGDKIGIEEKEVVKRIRSLMRLNIIKRITPTLNPQKLGYKSSLIAMKVKEERLKEVIGIINKIEGVTHNYLREHNYNLWFTLIAKEEDMEKIIEDIKRRSGIEDLLRLDSVKPFKLRFTLDINEESE
jgi:DNA-binding Lrp family transcriptional regulator